MSVRTVSTVKIKYLTWNLVISLGQINRKLTFLISLIKLHFGLSIITGFEMISRMRKRERERERTGKQAGGFTLFIIKVHKQTKLLHV